MIEDAWMDIRSTRRGRHPGRCCGSRDVTKRTGEETDNWPGYKEFILRVASHPVARRVKLADLEDNMDLRRISNPTEKDFARLKKYRRAYALLRALSEDPESGAPVAVTDMAAVPSTI